MRLKVFEVKQSTVYTLCTIKKEENNDIKKMLERSNVFAKTICLIIQII